MLSLFNMCLKIENNLSCFWVQEEYEAGDELGRLNCEHSYHFQCIKQWVAQKNFCPVCKQQVAARHWVTQPYYCLASILIHKFVYSFSYPIQARVFILCCQLSFHLSKFLHPLREVGNYMLLSKGFLFGLRPLHIIRKSCLA